MAFGRSARTGAGGGVGIQAVRKSDARVAAGIVAVAGAALLALAARLAAADAPKVAGVAGLAGAALLALGLLTRKGAPVTAGLALVGAGYGLSLVGKGLDPWACLFAGGLVAVAELAYWALEPGAAVRIGRAATARRAVLSGSIALAAVLIGALLLAVVSAPVRGGAALGVLGVTAIAAILAVAVGLMRSLRDSNR